MKAIINGLRYDTAKAIKIGSACSSGGRSSSRWWDETLYRTPRSGRYFLAGEGGPASRWATSLGVGQGWNEGSGIRPLDEASAREWAEEYLSADEVEAGFKVEDA